MEFLKDIVGSFGTITPTNTFILLLLIILVLAPFYFLKDTIAELLKGWFSYKKPKNRKVSEAMYHDIFNLIDQVKTKIDAIQYTTHKEYDATKTILIAKLINNQLDITRTVLLGLINKEGIDAIDNQQLKYEVITALKTANEKYNELSKMDFLEMGVSLKDIDFLLTEYAKFRDDIFEGFIDRVESISSNNVYTTNFHRISASFEVIAMGLHLIARDSIYTCSQINGRFKKYIDTIN